MAMENGKHTFMVQCSEHAGWLSQLLAADTSSAPVNDYRAENAFAPTNRECLL